MTKLVQLIRAIEHQEGADRPNTLPARLNNPGDLLFANQIGATPHPVTGCDGKVRKYASFPTIEVGRLALMRQINLDVSRNLTLEQFIHKYAPESDANDEKGYLAAVMRALGCTDATRPLGEILYGEETPELSA